MVRRSFDYPTFLSSFRARCRQLGIDPQVGASSYQAVHAAVRQQRQQRRMAPPTVPPWWRDYTLWIDGSADRSETERLALWQLYLEAFGDAQRLVERQLRARCETIERVQAIGHTLTLRELLAQRGEQLTWVDMGRGNLESVVAVAAL